MATVKNEIDKYLQTLTNSERIVPISFPTQHTVTTIAGTFSLTNLAQNFSTSNDNNTTTPSAPSAVTQEVSTRTSSTDNGTVDITVSWTNNNDYSDIDGFLVYARSFDASNTAYTLGSAASASAETIYASPINPNSTITALTIYGVVPTKYYNIGVQAYRRVNSNITSTGILTSAIIKASTPTYSWQPSATLQTYLNGTALTGLLFDNSNYILKGAVTVSDAGGGIKVGTVTWNTATGVVTGGTGLVLTTKGLAGVKAGVTTFTISDTGDATFKGTVSASVLSSCTVSSAAVSSGYITVGSSGYVSSVNKTTYTDTSAGFWLGADGADYKVKIGSGTKYLDYAPSTGLSIVGADINTTGDIVADGKNASGFSASVGGASFNIDYSVLGKGTGDHTNTGNTIRAGITGMGSATPSSSNGRPVGVVGLGRTVGSTGLSIGVIGDGGWTGGYFSCAATDSGRTDQYGLKAYVPNTSGKHSYGLHVSVATGSSGSGTTRGTYIEVNGYSTAASQTRGCDVIISSGSSSNGGAAVTGQYQSTAGATAKYGGIFTAWGGTEGFGLKGEINGGNWGIVGHTAYAFYAGAGGYSPFTGSHDALISKIDKAYLMVGDIIEDINIVAKNGVSDVLTEVTITKTPKSKRVVGIYSCDVGWDFVPASLTTDVEYHRIPAGGDSTGTIVTSVPIADTTIVNAYINTHDKIVFNAVGEGQVNVCGENGNIEIGDFICSSSIPGKGMKQDSDTVLNITVAKSRENVTFSSPQEVKQVACIYLCG